MTTTTIKRAPSLGGWIAAKLRSIADLLKPGYTAGDMAAAVAKSGNPTGA